MDGGHEPSAQIEELPSVLFPVVSGISNESGYSRMIIHGKGPRAEALTLLGLPDLSLFHNSVSGYCWKICYDMCCFSNNIAMKWLD